MFFRLYRRFISPIQHIFGRSLFGSYYACLFSPTCSVYFATAVRKYGIIHGGLLGFRRLLRCHPFSHSPHLDPVPLPAKASRLAGCGQVKYQIININLKC